MAKEKYGGVYDNIRKSARYDVISEISEKKKETIKMYFFRNKLDIDSAEDVKKYLKNFILIKNEKDCK